jgi:hypothetical protein
MIAASASGQKLTNSVRGENVGFGPEADRR